MESTNGNSNSKSEETQSTTYDPSEFKIQSLDPNKTEEYVQFANDYFWTREQLSTGCRVPPAESAKVYDKLVRKWISLGASVCAVHSPTNTLAGIQLNHIVTKDSGKVYGVNDFGECSQYLKNFMSAIDACEEAVNFFEDPNVEKYLEIALTAVNPKFTRNRLAYRMGDESDKIAIEMGCQLVVSHSTNKITQHLRKKMGMEPVKVVDYASLKVDNKRIVDLNLMNGTTEVHIMMKKLKN